MRSVPLFFLCTVLLAGVGCSKASRSPAPDKGTYWVAFRETQCNAYPWERGIHESVVSEQQVVAFYKENRQINILQVVGTKESPQGGSCQECGCETGTVVRVAVDSEKNQEALLILGFTEKSTPPEAEKPKGKKPSEGISAEDVLRQRAENLGETYDPPPSNTSGQKRVRDVSNTTEENNATHRTGSDGLIEQTAKYLQQMLWMEFLTSNQYPETLNGIDLTGVDLNGITYLPKGEKPYQDYELRAEYSDAIDVFHPLDVEGML